MRDYIACAPRDRRAAPVFKPVKQLDRVRRLRRLRIVPQPGRVGAALPGQREQGFERIPLSLALDNARARLMSVRAVLTRPYRCSNHVSAGMAFHGGV